MSSCLGLGLVQVDTSEIQQHRRVRENSVFFVALTRLTGREHLTSPTFLINVSPQCLYAWKYFASVAACIQKTQRHFTNRNELSLTAPFEGETSVFCTWAAQEERATCSRPCRMPEAEQGERFLLCSGFSWPPTHPFPQQNIFFPPAMQRFLLCVLSTVLGG